MNARSLGKDGAIDVLHNYMLINNISAALVTETWLSADAVSNAELSHNGDFQVFRHDRNRHGGGVLILVTKYLSAVNVPLLNISSEIVACDIMLAEAKIRLINAYFSPTGSSEVLLNRMQSLVSDLTTVADGTGTTILAGDFNLPDINWENLTTSSASDRESKEGVFINFCVAQGLSQFVKRPTHGTSSILDLVFSNDDAIYSLDVLPNVITSDHRIIRFSVDAVPRITCGKPCYIDYNKADFPAMEAMLANTEWNAFFANCACVDAMYEQFITLLHAIIRAHAPSSRASRSNLNAHIADLCKSLEQARSEREVKYLQKALARSIKRQRILTEYAILKSSCPKAIFNYVRKRIVVKDTLTALRRPDGTVTTDDREKAEILRSHFAKTYPSNEELQERELRAPPTLPAGPLRYTVEDVDVTPANVARHLQQIQAKTSESPDGIPAIIFKKLGFSICEPLSMIFRRSLDEGKVPEKFRVAVVCPVHKKGSHTDPANKRPISLTVVPSKILESIISRAIYTNASSQGLISSAQFAYRPGLSATLQLLETQFDWAKELNNNHCFDAIFFDLQSAFERVTHAKLIALLPSFGIGTILVQWITDFLSDRTFRVRVNEHYSDTTKVTSGCPQGTILGPLMFILYINSLEYILPPTISTKVYADDIKIYARADTESQRSLLQQTLNDFSQWCTALDLKLSVEKCAVLHFGHRNAHRTYAIYNQTIQSDTTVKDLGVVTLTSLKYSDHVNGVTLRASRRANWILRAFSLTDPALYIKLFTIYVEPMITYASSVWYPGLKKDQETLDRLRRSFIRRVAYRCQCDRNSVTIEPLLSKLDYIDQQTFARICSKSPALAEKMFDFRETRTRAKVNIIPKFIASKEFVNDLFPWRVSRKLREIMNHDK